MASQERNYFLPVVWALVDLVPGVGLLLHRFDGLRVRRLLLHFDYIRRAGLGSWGEAAQRGQSWCSVGIQTFGLELSLSQEHLPAIHLLLQLVVVRLWETRVESVSRLVHGLSSGFVARGNLNSLTTTYLLPGVKSERGDANLFDLLFSGSKQQVPVRFGWKGYLQNNHELTFKRGKV